MKRHDSLAPLSREHHSALILARLLRNDAPAFIGLPQEPSDKVAYAVKMYRNSLIRHFQLEEELLEKAKNVNAEIDALAAEIFLEHQQLSALFLSLDKATDIVESLDKLGRLLEAHVRKEERVLFPLIQDKCSEELLGEIKLLLS